MLSESSFFMLNTYFWDKNGLLLLNFGYVAKIDNLSLSPFFFLQILTDNILLGLHI